MDSAGQTVSATTFAQLTGCHARAPADVGAPARVPGAAARRRRPPPLPPARRAAGRRRAPRVRGRRPDRRGGRRGGSSTSRRASCPPTRSRRWSNMRRCPSPRCRAPSRSQSSTCNGTLARLAPVTGDGHRRRTRSCGRSTRRRAARSCRRCSPAEHEEALCEHPRWDGRRRRGTVGRLPAAGAAADSAARRRWSGSRPTASARWRTSVAALQRSSPSCVARRAPRALDGGDRRGSRPSSRSRPAQRRVDSALDTLVRQLNATDAALATYLSGQLAVASSRRGSLGPAMLTVDGAPSRRRRAARRAARRGSSRPRALALGVPAGLHAVRRADRRRGRAARAASCCCSTSSRRSTPDVRRLLTAVSAAVGFALLRDRLRASELRDAAGQA